MHWSEQLPDDPDVDSRDAAHPVAVVVLVFLGGCVGGLLRYAVTRHWPEPAGGFPWGTFAVNIAGAFALAVVIELSTELHPRWVYLRPLAGAGLAATRRWAR